MINIFLNRFGKFRKSNKGAVTILLIIVMVPLLLLSSFLVDVVRVKSYSQDALMAADNYAEGYLAEYNNLLKQLYGLYAISDSTSGYNEVANYKQVVIDSFTPKESSFTPYNKLNISLNEKMVEDSTLSHRKVIRTQIGDFMRFRIAQMLLMDGEELMQAKDDVKAGQSIADKAKILEAKTEFDEKYADAVIAILKFYDKLEKFHELQGLDDEMKNALLDGAGAFQKAAEDGKTWEETVEKEEELDWHLSHSLSGGDEPFPGMSKEEKKRLRQSSGVESKLNDAIGGIQEAQEKYNEKMKELSTILDDMETELQNVNKKLEELDRAGEKFYKKLDEYKGTDTQVIESMRIDAQKSFESIGVVGTNSEDTYKKLIERLKKDREVPDKINDYVNDALKRMNEDKTQFMNVEIDSVLGRDAFESIKDIEWETVEYTISNSKVYHEADKNIYDKLKKLHDAYNNMSEEEAAKKVKEATDAQNEQIKKLEELVKKDKPDKKARDIPKKLGDSYGDEVTVPELEDLWTLIKGIFKNAGSLFDTYNIGMEGWGLQMLSRLYVPYYDFGMFTCRTTGKLAGKNQQTVSLTGLVQDGSNHWMYGAEIEYILCHHRQAEMNLRAVKTWIIMARIVLNYWSTYQVKWIDVPIKIAAVAGAIIGLYNVIDRGLRIAVMAAETAADWSILDDGGKIVFLKREVGDLSAIDALKSILKVSNGAPNKDKKGSKYWSYIKICKALMLIMVTPDEVVDRTSNLITVNTNYIMMGEEPFKNISGKDALFYNPEKAYTAVQVTCKVNSDAIVMNRGWQRWVAPSTSTSINNIFGREYSYTVIRGY